jgi:RNA polymerase sigma-70 factor (ECF subfamily)
MPDPAEDFAALLTQVRQGNDDALTQLIRHYETEIRLVARLKLGPSLRRYLDSLDLTQSVHLTLLRGLREESMEITGPEHLVRLAVLLVRRKLARHLRQLYRRERLLALMAERGELPGIAVGPGTSSPTDPALAVSLRDAVEQVLRQLDGEDRRLVELRFEGYTTAEVARELGVSADVLRVRLGRLRKRLRDQGMLADWL